MIPLPWRHPPVTQVCAAPSVAAPALSAGVPPPEAAESSLPADAACLHEFIEAQARRQPEAEALLAGTERVTYRELNERANRLARYLQSLGVGRETLVGVFLPRSVDLVVALLGVLKAGGAYVPLDPAYPESRLQFMLADTQAPMVVTHSTLAEQARAVVRGLTIVPRFVCVDTELAPGAPGGNPSSHADPASLAYVIYTSGSTGQPKGVGLEHRNAAAFVRWAETWFQPGELGGVLASTSVCFDVSMFEIFTTLGLGGRVILAANALELASLPGRDEVRLVVTSPSVMREILRMQALPPSVVAFALAGEALDQDLVRRLYAFPQVERVYDLYGPTETTTYSTACLRQPQGPATIGRPIANTQVHLLDEVGVAVPDGQIGEIFIGGAGVARGYLNRPELTAARFVPNPYSTAPGARLYRTGDLGRWRPDGDLEYLGRVDHQVKIHGFRIELGEIEFVLRSHPGVSEAVVMAREDRPGDRRLVAYVVADVARETTNGLVRELRARIQEQLPHYMVPGAIVMLPRLPLTPNGKTDRAALPPPSYHLASDPNSRPPASAVEQKLCEIWADVLGLPAAGVEDDFFLLGGDSLLAVKLVLAVERHFQVSLRPETVFQAPTVARFAPLLATPVTTGSSLVPLQAGAGKPALVLVHGIGGGMLWGYQNLCAHLDPAQPLYALQTTGAPSADDESIERMAARHVRSLRALQPTGPYQLGGFCFGGNVAFEMARQLERAGEAVRLFLINATPPNSAYELPRRNLRFAARFVTNVGRWLRRFCEWDAPNRRRFYAWKLRTLRQFALPSRQRNAQPAAGIDRDPEINLAEVPEAERPLWQAHREALRHYQPQFFGGEVTLLRTSAHQFVSSFDSQFGWGPYAARVNVRIVPGLHQSMLQEPHVRAVARQLQAALDEPAVAPPPPVPDNTHLRLHPVAAACTGMLNRVSDAIWERRLGIATSGRQPCQHADGERYETMPYEVLDRIFDRLALGPSAVVADLGSGLGRIVCFAARERIREVVGVEIDAALHARAERNVSRLRGRRAAIRLHGQSATEFDFAGVTAVVLFNPFGESTLRAVLGRLRASWLADPRAIQIVYANAVHGHLLATEPWLELSACWPMTPWGRLRYPVQFYRSRSPAPGVPRK
jgi:amino acid adenylation domain-containing protein